MANKWRDINHKATDKQLAKARRALKRQILIRRIQMLPENLAHGAVDEWRHNKTGLALAAGFIAAATGLAVAS